MLQFRSFTMTFSRHALLFVFAFAFSLRAQNVVLDHATGSSPLPNGVEIQAGDAREQITALRDDVLRVRIAPHGQMPEDASWAVSAENRHSSVAALCRTWTRRVTSSKLSPGPTWMVAS